MREALGLELAETWQRQITRVVPGSSPVSCDFVYPAAAGDERYDMRMGTAEGGKVLALIRPRVTTAREVREVARLAGRTRGSARCWTCCPGRRCC